MCEADKYIAGSFADALNCMSKGGDVVVTTLHEMKKFFENPINNLTRENYIFLCRDQSTRPSPCPWTRQPLSLVIANR